MSAELTLLVMGPLEIRSDGAPVSLPAKTQALLVYLVMTGRRARREALADMFWGDTGEDGARANLRLALTKLRQALPGLVDADAESVGLVQAQRLDVDALQLLRTVDALLQRPLEEQEAAVARYRGPFLQDFVLRDCAGFEDWVNSERQRIDRRVVVLLRELVQAARRAAKPAREILHLSQWARIEPWNEEVQMPLIRLLAQTGATAAALDSFELSRRAMAEELGVKPSVALAMLADKVRRGEVGASPAPDPVVAAHPAPTAVPAGKPQTLYGREEDIHLVHERVRQGDRLILLLGPAGVGKSSLAAELSRRLAPGYEHGRVTCGFDFLEQHDNEQASQDHFVSVLGTALGLGLTLTAQPLPMLKTHLSSRRILMVLDGFEACINATTVLSELLLAAPGCLFIVTSRTRLPMAYGWVHELRGLAAARPGEREPGLALLLDCARRIGVELDGMDPHSREDLTYLVHLLDGSPLAIQFAAQSLRVLSPAQLVQRLEQGEWLDSSLHLPEYRYNRMQDVMADMWSQLRPELRDAWMRCALFKGPFDLDWAHDCAGVDDRLLAQLMERSILGRETQGRLRMHELTRQYGLRMLDELPKAQALRSTFCQAALARLVALSDQLLREDAVALHKLQPEIATLAAAFDEALMTSSPEEIHAPLLALQRLYHRLGWHKTSARLVDAVLAHHASAPVGWRIIWHYMAGTVVHNQYGYQSETAHFKTAVALGGVRLPPPGASAWLLSLRSLLRALVARPLDDELARGAQRALTHCLLALALPLYVHGERVSQLLAYLCAAALAARRSGHADAHLAVRIRVLAIDRIRRFPRLQAALVRWTRNCMTQVDPVHEAFALDHMVMIYIRGGRWAEALAQLRRTSRTLAAMGYGYDALECEGRRNFVLLHKGDFNELLREVAQAEAEARRIQQPMILRWALLFKMQALLRTRRGTVSQALECLHAVHAIPVRRVLLEEVRVGAHEALCLAAQGDVAGVLERARDILPRTRHITGRFHSMAPLAVLVDAVLHVATDPALTSDAARDMAASLADRFSAMSRGMQILAPRSHLYRGIAALTAGHTPRAVQWWQRGLQCSGAEELAYDSARLHWMLALNAAQDEQADHADKAQALFARCGVLGPPYPFLPSAPVRSGP
ncbi:MAG: BTAD domain-containing putative transcriptional regulator [Ramlibacter sp.]